MAFPSGKLALRNVHVVVLVVEIVRVSRHTVLIRVVVAVHAAHRRLADRLAELIRLSFFGREPGVALDSLETT